MRFGLDLGGTKMEAVLLDNAGAIIWRERRPTPAGDYDAILEVIAELTNKARAESGVAPTIGICMPGSLSSKTGLVRNSNTQSLQGRAIKEDLESKLGCNVRLANDANCFALSEAADGAGANARSRIRRDFRHRVWRRPSV
jgi:fructokinase